MNASQILAIPLDEPERLFKDHNNLKHELFALLKAWHPDVNKDPNASSVATHINALYARATVLAAKGSWQTPNLLILKGKDGRERRIAYRARRSFELGLLYIGETIATYVIDRKHENLVLSGLRAIGTIRYPDESFRRSLEQYFPKVEHYFETDDSFVICMRKRKDEVLLSDLIVHLGGKMDPKHVAWVLSCLFNLASFLHISKMTVNGIEPQTVFVSTPTHSLSILGGWWYGANFGKPMTSLPPAVYRLAPRKLINAKKAVSFLDLESIRAIGRTALGDITGTSFRMNADIPKPMASFLILPSSYNAVQDYQAWSDTLKDSFGPRKFVKLEVTMDDVYPRGTEHV